MMSVYAGPGSDLSITKALKHSLLRHVDLKLAINPMDRGAWSREGSPGTARLEVRELAAS